MALGESYYRIGWCELQKSCTPDGQSRWLCRAGYERLQVRLVFSQSCLKADRKFRYFGRAKELPGVKELFEEQGEDHTSWLCCIAD